MNELQCEYFLAIAENLSFTKTAAEKYVSQPAVSKQIALLEEELGIRLFERGRKTTQLTDAGSLFVDYLQKQQVELKNITQIAKNLQTQGTISFRIATGTSWTLDDFLPKTSAEIFSKHPHAKLMIESYQLDELDWALHENNADVVIGIAHSIRATPSVEIRHFTDIPRAIAYSRNHPLAGKRNLKPQDFKSEIFFYPSLHEKTFVKNLLKGCIEPYGFIPELQAVRNDQTMIANVINGYGVAMVDTWFLSSYKHALKAVRLATYHPIILAWAKNNANPILDTFLREIRAPAESPS
jgi:DNA-binding transcriptional LysR family regulator